MEQCFVYSIMWCCHNGNHPQGNLAIVGYGPTMKVKKILKSFYIMVILLEQCV
jgi:hypothetical protein